MGGDLSGEGFTVAQGGYIPDYSLLKMYKLSAKLGVTHFVVPGTKPDKIAYYYKKLEPIVARVSNTKLTFYVPGLITQGGSIDKVAKVAGLDGTQ